MERRAIWVGAAGIIVIGLAALMTVLFTAPKTFRGSIIEPSSPAPEIPLTTHSGEIFRVSDHRGSVLLLFFGYTSCPDICPATMAELKQARALLRTEEAERVQVVFITVDPQRDTPDAIQEYVERFDPTFLGLSGSQAELSRVWQAYGVYREEGEPNMNGWYEVSHTARVYAIDPQGALRLSFAFGTFPEDVANDIRILLGGNRN
ncbi:MAG: SCO family protein [Chloroflexi bacterium]|nr:SCO family protein [Chloroflexota bacterium]